MRIRFWGTRGSLPRPAAGLLRYGGNTLCVEVRTDDGTLIVLDCGSGAHDLGRALLAGADRGARGHLLITHTHWDHIQGFPFFAPLHVPGHAWDVYAPRGLADRLEATLAGQMEYTYFPITLADLGATIRYHELTEGRFPIGGAQVQAQYLNHPALTLGYRVEVGGASFVYATDHEPHARQADLRAGAALAHREDQRHVAWMAGADLVVHDTQYSLAEYPERIGWGHTPAELAVDFALEAGARRLALFHHDPSRDDDALDRLVESCRARAAGSDLEVFGAAEGQEIVLPETAAPVAAAAAEAGAAGRVDPVGARATVLIADDDAGVLDLLSATLEPEGYRLITADDGEAALALARDQRPDRILLDWAMPERTGLDVCRALRAEADPRLRDVPIVLITARTGPEATAAGFAAGVTDYLNKPFKPTLIRSRVRAWLLRQVGAGRSG